MANKRGRPRKRAKRGKVKKQDSFDKMLSAFLKRSFASINNSHRIMREMMEE